MGEVRVRIAPSPTGSPHVGTAYIALFNYVFARSRQGKFVLRIEDTDQVRSHPVYERQIIEALRWIGLTWDEGPDVGGEHAPYRQSERTEIYRQHADKLILKDGAYRCFCTPERLAKMREEQRQRNLSSQYDGKCRQLSEAVIAKKLKDKEPYVVRLKVPHRGKCQFDDRLRKEVVFPYKEVDDQVLLKSDGFPTYHLANVVDDHLMKITHVIRGEEWLSSTPKHVLIYEFMGWEQPEFIHMPLLLNPDGSKLSKRKNPTSIFYYRDTGYLPEALLNFLGLMGYTRPNGEEKFTLQEMISDFNIDRISLGGSIFDFQKLNWLSAKYIRENLSPQAVYRHLVDWRLNEKFFLAMIPHMQPRMETLGDFLPVCSFLWAREVDYAETNLIPKIRSMEETAKVLQSLLWVLEEDPGWNTGMIEKAIRLVADSWGWKIRELTTTLFIAISGRKVAPPLFESMELLGKDLSRVRILRAIEKLGGISKNKLQDLEREWQAKRQILEEAKQNTGATGQPGADLPG